MKKAGIGIVIIVVVAVLGGFGFQAWLKSKVQTETEQSFAALRASGVDARFSSTDVSLLSQKVTISGVRISSENGDSVLDIEKLVLRISTAPSGERMQADEMDFSGVRMTLKGAPAGGGQIVYIIPDMDVIGYEGPMNLLPSDQHGGPYAALRLGLRQFATLKADEVRIPQATVTITPAPDDEASSRSEVTYRDIALDQIATGKVRKLSIAEARFRLEAPAPAEQNEATTATDVDKPGPVTTTGEIRDIIIHEIDSAPVLAATAPAAEAGTDAKDTAPATLTDEPYQRIFRQLETGPHLVASPDSTSKGASTLIEDFGIRPAAFAPERIATLNALNLSSPSISLEDAQRALGLTVDVLQAVQVKSIRVSESTSQEKDATTSMSLLLAEDISNGIITKLEMKDAEVRDQDGQTRFGRFAINRLDLPALARFSEAANESLPDASLLLFRIISGFEIEDASVPGDVSSSGKGGPITVGRMALTWGELLGDAPTRLELVITDISGPISAQDEMPFNLLASTGMTRAKVSLLLKMNYDQASQTLSIAPAESDLDGALKMQLNARLENVAKEIFTEEGAMEESLMNITIGPVSLSVTNQGLAQLLLKEQARAAGVSEEEYREQVIALLTALAPALSDAPETAQVLESVIAFIKDPKTLTLTATPKGAVSLIDLVYSENRETALKDFTISATTSP
ncbi:hypothetical protein ACT6QG_11725 [Xanthobacter sp. TB0136]|uniref:hypothetical protein n=1 Tax=Xanthobacter sp. TB0136 TaxID=3459177 RepID=UPI0040390A9F